MVGHSSGQQAAAGFNENVVFVDAAHGGTDLGAHLGGAVEEKDVTLALAGRVRSALAAKGFSIVMSREGDATVPAEQRAGVANHARPLACLLLHASASGNGAALAISTLTPFADAGVALPWAAAQASSIGNSMGLREQVGEALKEHKVGTVMLRASTPPVDSLTCAAMIVELGPMGNAGAGDADYQTRVAEAVAQALVAWKIQVAPVKAAPATKAAGANGVGPGSAARAAGTAGAAP